MTLMTLVPVGVVLVALIGFFWVGLVMGWLSQEGLNRVLRYVAVRKAVRETVAAMQPPGMVSGHPVTPELPAAKPNLAPWYADRTTSPGHRPPIQVRAVRVDRLQLPPAVAGPTTTPVDARPGILYYRDPSGGVFR